MFALREAGGGFVFRRATRAHVLGIPRNFYTSTPGKKKREK